MSTRKLKFRSGMTIMELLVAMVIVSVLFISAISIVEVQGRAFTAGTEQLTVVQNLQYVANTLETNLRTVGSGVAGEQPFLIYADTSAIAFNANYTTNVLDDPWAVYADTSLPTDAVMAMQQADRILLPGTDMHYPDTSYITGGANSEAETITFFFTPDTTTDRADDYLLYRQVNDLNPEMVARNILHTESEPFLKYTRLVTPDTAPSYLTDVTSGQLPLRHSAPLHLMAGDTGVLALIDSVRAARVTYSISNGLEGDKEDIRAITRFISFPNAGLGENLSCGDEPILGTDLKADAYEEMLADSSWVSGVRLKWDAAEDETSGEGDIIRYVIYRAVGAAPSVWGEPYLSIPAGKTSYSYDDTNVSEGTSYYYALAAQDCTPNISPLVSAGPVVP